MTKINEKRPKFLNFNDFLKNITILKSELGNDFLFGLNKHELQKNT